MGNQPTPSPVTGSAGPPPGELLMRLINGHWTTQAIYVAAQLGLADALAEGPRRVDELASEVQAEPQALYRLLRALASFGVFTEGEDGRFALTPAAEGLRSGVDGSLRGMAIHTAAPWHWAVWGELLHSVRTGATAVSAVHGQEWWDYLAGDREAAAAFHQAMTDHARAAYAAVPAHYDFSGFDTVVDVGGGQGALLVSILSRSPSVRGILVDQPDVVQRAQHHFEAAGLSDRSEVVGGDFFASVPKGGDAYVLAMVLHDWSDEAALAILRRCREAIPMHGKLLVCEMVVPPGNEPSFAKLLDLEMLIGVGGRERTEEEYRALFAEAGFTLERVVPTPTPFSVLESSPA